MQNRAMCPFAQVAEHLKGADFFRHQAILNKLPFSILRVPVSRGEV
jgi:hypothetical protein